MQTQKLIQISKPFDQSRSQPSFLRLLLPLLLKTKQDCDHLHCDHNNRSQKNKNHSNRAPSRNMDSAGNSSPSTTKNKAHCCHSTPISTHSMAAHTPWCQNRGQNCAQSTDINTGDGIEPPYRSLLRPNQSSQSPFADYILSPQYDHHHQHRQSSWGDISPPARERFASRDSNAVGALGFASHECDDLGSRGFAPSSKHLSRDFDDLGACGFAPTRKGFSCEINDSGSFGFTPGSKIFSRELGPRGFMSHEFNGLGPHGFASRDIDNLGFRGFASPAVEEPFPFPGTSSKGTHSYSYGALSNEITLYHWYLIRPNGYHNSGIAVGGFLSTRAIDNETFETTAIIKRLEERKLLSKNGIVVNLVGTINDCATIANGFPHQMVQLFLSGFPNIWNLLVGMAFPVKQLGATSCSEFLGGGVMPESLTLERDTKHARQSLFSECKEKLPSSCLDFGNRAQADTEKNSLVDGNINIQITPKRRESNLDSETTRDPNEGIMQDNPLHIRMECYNENKEEPVDADIAININTLEEKFLSKNSKLDVDKCEAVTTCADIGAAADSCGVLNQSLKVACIESPIRDACETEQDMGAVASVDGSRKRKVRFRSKNESVAGSSSQTQKSSETHSKRVCQEPFDKLDQEPESTPAQNMDMETQLLSKGISHKKGISKKRGKPKKKVRLCLSKPRRSNKCMISKQKQGMVKNPVSLHEEEKMDTSENPKVASGEQEDCRGEMQQTKNIDDDRNNGNDPASCNEENYMEADQGSQWENKNCREMAHQKVDTKARIESCVSRCSLSTINSPEDECSVKDTPTDISACKVARNRLPPPLPMPTVSVSNQLVSKAFGLKTSRSGRLLVPPLAHWRNQSIVRDSDGGIIAIEDGSADTMGVDTGRFNFKPPLEARARKLQKWLSVTASKCFMQKLNSRANKKKRNVT